MFSIKSDCERVHRRDCLKIGAAGLLGLSLSELLRIESYGATGSTGRAKNVIMIWLAGGPSTIDMWDLKPDAGDKIRGEFKPIDTSASGIQIGERLPQTAKVMDQCTLVRSLHHSIPSHGPGTVYMHTGNKPTPALKYPSLGSLASKMLECPTGMPPYVAFDGGRDGATGAGYLGPAYNPFEVEGNAGNGQLRVRGISLPSGVSLDQLEDRNRLLQSFDRRLSKLDDAAELVSGLDQFQQRAMDILRSTRTREAFDLNKEPGKLRDRYGRDNFGQGVLAARRLVEAGVRFVTISSGGWDTHGNNFKSLRENRLPPVDRSLSALIEDLRNRGQLDETIVYCVGEFARTPKINDKSGRDHWAHSMAVLLAGGGFPKGFAYGSTDKEGMEPSEKACTPDDISATIVQALGVNPRRELNTSSARPIALFREGKVLSSIL